MSKVHVSAMKIVALCLTTFIASQAAEPDHSQKEKAAGGKVSECDAAINLLSGPAGKPDVIVGLDHEGRFTSAVFVSQKDQSNKTVASFCAKALPYRIELKDIKMPRGIISRVQPFVYLNYPGSGCHIFGYDSSGQALWYCH